MNTCSLWIEIRSLQIAVNAAIFYYNEHTFYMYVYIAESKNEFFTWIEIVSDVSESSHLRVQPHRSVLHGVGYHESLSCVTSIGRYEAQPALPNDRVSPAPAAVNISSPEWSESQPSLILLPACHCHSFNVVRLCRAMAFNKWRWSCHCLLWA